ncbi:MAG: family 20 glycosylhydrolase [Ferruginibacter sp.]
MKNTLLLFFNLCCANAFAQQQVDLNVVPKPALVKVTGGNFLLDSKTIILANSKDHNAIMLNSYLKKYYGFTLPIKNKPAKNETPIFFSEIHSETNYPVEGYGLNITKNKIEISFKTAAGAFYGMQTLIQLFLLHLKPPYLLPTVEIKDYPAFSYRGMHLDVSRHFFPVDYIKKYIDYLAMHKMNNFHWHLTDDQGWRIEIKKYPLLTSVGGCRNQTLAGRYGSDKYDGTRYCGFYTQEQIKEVVKYASDRYVNIIPEIEMPGHALAAITAYPELSCNPGTEKKVGETWGVFEDIMCPTDYTFNFLENVLTEVMALFPSTYIHIGGDEAPKEAWKNSAFAQSLIKEKNLKNEHELQSYFIQRIEKFVNSKGRKIMGWNEIMEGGLAPNAAVMSWQGEKGGIEAAKQKHYVVMTPEQPLYFDHSQTRNEDSLTRGNFNPLEKVYAYNPLPPVLSASEKKYIMGAQANVWTEYFDNGNKVDYMIFPRLSALSEVLWTPASQKNWASFEQRLPGLMKRYEWWNSSYSTAYYDLQPAVVSGPKNEIIWKLETRYPNAKIIYVKDSSTNASFPYNNAPLIINHPGLYGATITDNNSKIIGKWTWQLFELNKASGKKITMTTPPNASYAGQGGFSLIDGVQNKLGMLKSAQFIGFVAKDLEAVVDLENIQPINEIILHAFEQQGSWIYRPAAVSFFISNDGVNYTEVKSGLSITGDKNILYSCKPAISSRYIKVIAKNFGKIPSGMPGAGGNSWLFADEIEVK